MIRAIHLLAAVTLGIAPAQAAPGKPVDIRALNALDCTLTFTNDHVEDVIMMQDTTGSADACRTACERFAAQSLISMRDSVDVLRYRCLYRDSIVAEVDLKQD